MDQLKKIIEKILGDTSGITWKDLDHKKVYAAIAVIIAVIVLIIVGITSAFSGNGEKKPGKDNVTSGKETSEDQEEEPADENPLEVDAYHEINKVVIEYLYSLALGDIEMLTEVVDVLTEEEIETVEKKNEYIEAYHDVVCYTKKGLEENSYVVFASYEMELYNIETYAPGIMPLYVYQNESGDYVIFNGEASEELKNYVLELAAEEEVAAVIEDVDTRYQQLIETDEDHKKFAETMTEAQQSETETGSEEEPQEPADEPEEPVEEPEEPEEPEAVNKQMQFSDTVRIRADRSTESERIGTGYANELLTLIESYDDGWSKISYNGLEGYCKTEFIREPQ